MASLRDALSGAPDCSGRFLWGAAGSVSLEDLRTGTAVGGRLSELQGRSVLVLARDQLAAAVALIELDGIAQRLVIRPPAVADEHLPSVVIRGNVDALVTDDECLGRDIDVPLKVRLGMVTQPPALPIERRQTEWVLLTSGTTGVPKMIVHNFATLTAPIGKRALADDVVWGTHYDMRGYGGLQIFLRAIIGRRSLVLSGPDESAGEFLGRLGSHKVTHISGTPSHWRRALMSSSAHAIAPRYVRLSGEIADQAILNGLRSVYAQAKVGHAYASTEAGVGFEVNDGLEGFPAGLIGSQGDVEIRIEEGALRIRSPRTGLHYLGEGDEPLRDADGFVDTTDMVERRGDRYYFLGRKSGMINIGGLKVYPEEIEAVINRHPAVRMSIAISKKSPITGSVIVAEVVLKQELEQNESGARPEVVKREILELCHGRLAAHKVPATVRFVPSLEVAAAGKLVRTRG